MRKALSPGGEGVGVEPHNFSSLEVALCSEDEFESGEV